MDKCVKVNLLVKKGGFMAKTSNSLFTNFV